MTYINITFLIISAVLCFFSYRKKRCGLKHVSNKAYYLFLFLAIILAIFVRIAKFGSVPFGVNQDEAMAAVDAKALAMYGTDRNGMIYPVHFEAWGFGQMSVLMSYMMIPFIKLLGFSTVTVRLPSLIISFIALICLYFLCRDVFNRDLALVVLFFAAINPWHIIQSRWALDCNIFPHILIIAIYFLNHGLKRNGKRIFIYLSMIFFALSMYCYGISIYTTTLFLLISCIYLINSKRIKITEAIACALIYLAIAWPFIAVMVINTFSLPSIETKWFTIPYFASTIRSSDILFFSDNFFEQLLSNITSLLTVLFQAGDDYLANVVPGFSTMYVFTLPFAIVGFIWLLRTRKGHVGSTLILFLFAVGIFDGLITNNVNVNRINLIFYPIIIMNGIGIYSVIRNVKFTDIAIEVMFAVTFTLFVCTYFTSYSKDISENFSSDFQQAVCEIDKDSYDKIYITPDVQSKGRWYVSEILSLYCLDIDAKEYQSSDFTSKYIFKNPDEDSVNGDPDTAYVVSADDCDIFDKDKYDIFTFNRYAAVVPK